MPTALKRLGNLRHRHPALLQHLNLAVLRGRQLGASAAFVAPGPGRDQAGDDTLADERPFELGKGAQHAQEQLGVAGVIEGKYTVSYN
jgi:hypothetical protein